MILQVVSIYDSAAQCYSQPSFVPTVGSAVRSFQDLLNDSNSQCAKHPEDFSLFHLGTFNDELGLLEPKYDKDNEGKPIFNPACIARAIDYIPASNKELAIRQA